MKVFLDATLLNLGGSVQVGLSILENAAKTRKHEWHVALSETINRQISPTILKTFKSIEVFETSSKTDRLRLFLRMPSLVRKSGADLVFTIFGPSYWSSPIPHIQGFAHPTIIYPFDLRRGVRDRKVSSLLFDPIKRELFRRADYLMVETETVKKRLCNNLGISDRKIIIVENSYSPLFKKNIKWKSPGDYAESFIILIPSSYYKHKNLESVPRIAYELKKITKRKFRFLFTISQNDHAWKRILRNAQELEVEPLLRTEGSVPHEIISSLYNQSNAVFLPSLLECSTAVYPESFAAKLPLATSDLDFAHELCGRAALYFDPYSPADMAKKLLRLMDEPSLRVNLVKEGTKQLKLKYPSPNEKWRRQLACFEKVAFKGMGKINA